MDSTIIILLAVALIAVLLWRVGTRSRRNGRARASHGRGLADEGARAIEDIADQLINGDETAKPASKRTRDHEPTFRG